MEMMHPSLTMVIVTSPESYSLVAMVAIGVVGMAVGILILEAIAYYIIGFLMRAKQCLSAGGQQMKVHKNDTSLAGSPSAIKTSL